MNKSGFSIGEQQLMNAQALAVGKAVKYFARAVVQDISRGTIRPRSITIEPITPIQVFESWGGSMTLSPWEKFHEASEAAFKFNTGFDYQRQLMIELAAYMARLRPRNPQAWKDPDCPRERWRFYYQAERKTAKIAAANF